jgi:hypothetical protein
MPAKPGSDCDSNTAWTIKQVLVQYCHGVDRCDQQMLSQVFWHDAEVNYGFGAMPAASFCESLIPSLLEMTMTQHRLSNVMIFREGDVAKVQSYCDAFHLVGEQPALQEMQVGGRYLDRFECRDGIWKIARRTYVMDWNRNSLSTIVWDGPLYSQLQIRGARGDADPFSSML